MKDEQNTLPVHRMWDSSSGNKTPDVRPLLGVLAEPDGTRQAKTKEAMCKCGHTPEQHEVSGRDGFPRIIVGTLYTSYCKEPKCSCEMYSSRQTQEEKEDAG